jgi:hypothetical protein
MVLKERDDLRSKDKSRARRSIPTKQSDNPEEARARKERKRAEREARKKVKQKAKEDSGDESEDNKKKRKNKRKEENATSKTSGEAEAVTGDSLACSSHNRDPADGKSTMRRCDSPDQPSNVARIAAFDRK